MNPPPWTVFYHNEGGSAIKRAEIADAIRRTVSMRDVAAHYGVVVPRQGMMRCPLHADTNASFKVFSDGYKCFGCGAHGDQIDFVMALLGVDFWEAAGQINRDFSLGIRMDTPENEAGRRRADEMARCRSERRRALNRAEGDYWQAFDRWLLFVRLLMDRPPLSPMWCWAVNRIDNAIIGLDSAQARWIEVRKANV